MVLVVLTQGSEFLWFTSQQKRFRESSRSLNFYAVVRLKNLDPKIIKPTIKAITAAIKTPPAATSLMIFISGRFSGDTRLHNFSSAEFIASSPITNAETIKMANHSTLLIWNETPKIRVVMNAPNWTWKLRSVRRSWITPSKAYRKLEKKRLMFEGLYVSNKAKSLVTSTYFFKNSLNFVERSFK
jgi:hypothetical protein